MIKVSPSILACDFLHFASEIQKVQKGGAEYLHIDVMDGHFVPNMSFGMPIVEAARKATDMVLDVHLMISDPLLYAKRFAQAGADIITFHIEAQSDVKATIDEIHSCGKKAGLSIKPATDVSMLKPYLKDLELVLIMTVEPGFGGQKLIPETIDKVKQLKELCNQMGVCPEIEVDGGITPNNVKLLTDNGANVIVAGSAVFKSETPEKVIEGLKN